MCVCVCVRVCVCVCVCAVVFVCFRVLVMCGSSSIGAGNLRCKCAQLLPSEVAVDGVEGDPFYPFSPISHSGAHNSFPPK